MAQPYPFSPVLTALRSTEPLVQCLTNSVVMEISANVLLAAGASAAMVDTPEESAEFAKVASGVLINAGTPSAEKYQGMRNAIAGATEAGTPWVVDPVGAGGLAHRSDFLSSVLPHRPHAIRGNASEIMALAQLGAGGRGVDAVDGVDDALPAAHQLVADTGGVVAISGPTDLIVSAGRVTRLTSGDPMLQRVIGSGCSLGALTAAYLGASEGSPHEAVLTAHAHVGAAAQMAAHDSTGPGSFAVAWLDALYTISGEDISRLVAVEELSA